MHATSLKALQDELAGLKGKHDDSEGALKKALADLAAKDEELAGAKVE